MTLIDQYDRASPQWEQTLERHGFRAAYAALFAELRLPRKHAVCDMGTGAGDFAAAFLARNGAVSRLTLVDPSRHMLDAACNRLRLLGRSLERLEAPLEDVDRRQAFDLVLGAHVIEHCADPAAAVRMLADMTKPGGHVVLSVSKPHFCQWFIWLRWRHRWFAPERVRGWFAAAGLEPAATCAYPDGIPARVSLAYVARRPPA